MKVTMKTAREFLEKEFGAFGSDELRLALKNNLSISKIICAMENYTKQKLLQHGVMQAEGSDGAKGAAVGQRSVDTVAEGLTITNIKTGQLLNVEGHGFMFGTDKSTGEVKCFNISYLGKSSEEQP